MRILEKKYQDKFGTQCDICSGPPSHLYQRGCSCMMGGYPSCYPVIVVCEMCHELLIEDNNIDIDDLHRFFRSR